MKKLLFSNSVVGARASASLLILRLMFGLGMAFGHGWGKLMEFETKSESFMNFMGMGSSVSLALAVFAELFCAILVAMGLLTRAALIPLIVTMAVAAFMVHGADPFSGKEMALLYLAAYLSLFITGPGKFSGDHLVR